MFGMGRVLQPSARMSKMDGYANMVCMGKQATIIHQIWRFTNVNTLSEDVGVLPYVGS